MLQVCYYLLLLIHIVYAIYFTVPFLIGFKKKNKIEGKSKAQCKFCILIPARNEAIVIGNLIESLKQQNYNSKNYQIYVLINHCTDQTKQIALEKKVNVIDCPSTVKKKSDVLAYGFQKLKNQKFDAFLLLDADNLVHPDFCNHMNQSYQNGFQAAQCFRDSKNRNQNWLSGCYSIFYYIQNLYFYTKKKLGLSATFSGTGMMITKEIVDQFGYPMTTLTEDMEYSAFLATHNIPIDFVTKAITYDEQPNQFSISWKQRKRWTTGVYQCLQKYFKQLLQGKTNQIFKLDLFLIFFSPLLQVLTCTVGVIHIAYVILRYGFFSFFYFGIVFLLLTYLLMILFTIFVLENNQKNFHEMKYAILLFPLFLSTWIPIQFICLFKKINKWEPIVHKEDIQIENVK